MSLTEQQLAELAEVSGHSVEPLEKVLRLVALLNDLRAHPFLKERLALKGGTAFNLFVFDLPRLSVDIDLNYIGALDRETMLVEKPRVVEALKAVFKRQSLVVKKLPDKQHGGFKCELGYRRSNGQMGSLEVDLNFMLRTPLWPTERMGSRPIAGYFAESILILDKHELAAGKLAAAFSRKKSRDLFDLDGLFKHAHLNVDRMRLGFVAYGGMHRVDWRTRTLDHLDTDDKDVAEQLLPMLRRDVAPSKQDLSAWTRRMVENCRTLASTLLPLRPNELEFLDRLNDHGELRPELLTEDQAMRGSLAQQPMLLWKALSVRQHRGR